MPSVPRTTFIPYDELLSQLLDSGLLTEETIAQAVTFDRFIEEDDEVTVGLADDGVFVTVEEDVEEVAQP